METRKSSVEKMVVDQKFWKGKKVLLTGHTGFKGSWMSLWLQKLGVDLVGFSKSVPTEPSLFKIAQIEDNMESVMGNVCDFKKLSSTIEQFKPEIIIHMAAQSLVLKSYEDPLETFSTNILGTVNLLESVRSTVKNNCIIINITSDKCYDNSISVVPHKESDPMGGFDPYSSSKGCAELITSSFQKSFFNSNNSSNIALASVRAGNVIGGGDWSENRLIPDIMNSKLQNKTIKIRNPNSIRPWQHVLDPLHGYLLLAEQMWKNDSKFSEPWNFGPPAEKSKSVSWIVEKLTKLWGDGQWEIDSKKNQYESPSLLLDSSKANINLNWESKIDIDLALKWIVDWYKEFQNNKDMKQFTEFQIELFSKL
jgi:CDP-glucose 4,6-dehydratase